MTSNYVCKVAMRNIARDMSRTAIAPWQPTRDKSIGTVQKQKKLPII